MKEAADWLEYRAKKFFLAIRIVLVLILHYPTQIS
jgi:hypothetical protein